MSKDQERCHSIRVDTLCDLFRDLDAAVMMMVSSYEPHEQAGQYVDTLALLWEATTGESMRLDEAMYIFSAFHNKGDVEDV